ncbi:MAG: DEAD/DEAH box helicase [Hyphomicrobiales bacterium]|nr:DEAD/DEAH box helicase [Hyphomicrobiales bacterium]
MMQLRPYQERDIAAIRATYANGAHAVLYQAPTGSGKTVLFSFVVAGAAARGNSVCILGHRQEIVGQISGALDEIGIPHGMIAAGAPMAEAGVQVASVATLARRLRRVRPPDLLVIDEAHHAVAGTWRKIIAAFPEARILGVTATPERLDGKGLGDVFDELIIGPAVAELIEAEYLSRFTVYAPDRAPDLSGIRTRMGDYAVDQLASAMSAGVVIDAAVDEYQRRCDGAPAIVFCVDIKHSQLVAARFAARGYRAAHLDGDTPADERRRIIAALATTEVQVVTNCGLISEGLDVPNVTAAILLRPTQSLALYLQQVGRAMRPSPGKARALILDHAGNVYSHGLPDAPRDWSLDGRARAGSGAAPVRRCPECGAINALAARTCSECGTALRQPTAYTEAIAPEPLVPIEQLVVMTYREALTWAGSDERRLRHVALARGYHQGWVWHRLREIEGGVR